LFPVQNQKSNEILVIGEKIEEDFGKSESNEDDVV